MSYNKILAAFIALWLHNHAEAKSNFSPGTGKICNSVLTLKVEVKELDTNGLWNHLLLSKPTAAPPCGGEDGKNSLVVSGQVHLSWSQVKDQVPYEEGQVFKARITASCTAGYGVYEAPGLDSVELPYRIWTCNVDSLQLIDR